LSDLPTLEDLREEVEGEDPPLQTQIEFSNSEADTPPVTEDEEVSTND